MHVQEKPTLKRLIWNHVVVGGQTNSGKSYFTKKMLLNGAKREKDIVVYVNPQREDISPAKGFTTLQSVDFRRILRYRYINLYLDENDELDKLVRGMLILGEKGVTSAVAIDEAHLFEKAQNLDKIPRMGRKYGVHQITISQRLNDVTKTHKAVLTQSRYIVLFSLSRFEVSVLRYYQLQDLIDYKLPRYHYIVFDTVQDEIYRFKPI